MIGGFISAAWTALRGSRVLQLLLAAVAALALLWAVHDAGQESAREEALIEDLKEAVDVHRRAEEAQDSARHDAGALGDDDLCRELRDIGAWRDGDCDLP